MNVEKFTDAHYTDMCKWYEARGKTSPKISSLPRMGFVIPGVAATFAYEMEQNMLWSDGTISNPTANVRERNEAITALFQAVIAEAKRREFKFIISNTAIPAIADYAKEVGCKVTDGSFTIVKDLR